MASRYLTQTLATMSRLRKYEKTEKKLFVLNCYAIQILINGKQSSDAIKLIDGVLRTHDENHIWQINSTQFPIKIAIKFTDSVRLALIRLWNYNRSRIYSYRGVKDVVIMLDDVTVFKGEIAKAYGELIASPERLGDVSWLPSEYDSLILLRYRLFCSLRMRRSWRRLPLTINPFVS